MIVKPFGLLIQSVYCGHTYFKKVVMSLKSYKYESLK